MIETNQENELKWYQKTWFIILMLILFAPLGVIMMWAQGKFTKRTRIVVTSVLAFLTLVSALGNDPASTTSTNTNSVATIADNSQVKEKTKEELAAEAKQKAAEETARLKAEAEQKAKEATEAKAKAIREANAAKAAVANFKKASRSIGYKALARDPDKYYGTKVVYNGKVVQVMEDGNIVNLRVNITKGSYGFWDDTVLVMYERPSSQGRILEDDIIKFWGTSAGLETYTTVLGSEMTIPKIEAKYLTVTGNQK